jgi:uncharacterized protein with PIN domain
VDGRLEAGFRHRLRTLLAAAPPGSDPEQVEDLIARAREESRREGVPYVQSLLRTYEQLRARVVGEDGRHATTEPPRFLCDPSLGGLARWLRAAGYEARLLPDSPPHRLPDEARQLGLVLLTTDAETLERRIVADGSLRVVWLPTALTVAEKLALVMRDLRLPLREPRCMACGGELVRRDMNAVRPRIPPRTARWKDEYFVCSHCDRLYWQGTHWQRILPALRAATVGA